MFQKPEGQINLLDKLGMWVREKLPLWHRFERWVWGLPAFPSAVLTALGHGLLTALAGPFAPVVATLYTVRELQQAEKRGMARDKTNWPPFYDSVLDAVVPWFVVCGYVFLLGRLLG